MLFISMLVLENISFGGKQLPVLPPWLHPVCDVGKATVAYFSHLTFLWPKNEVD